MWSQVCGKIAMLVHKVTLKKKKAKNKQQQKPRIKKKKLESTLFFKAIFFNKLANFLTNLRPHY